MSLVILEVFNDLQGAGSCGKILHYTDGIKGCGTYIEQKIQTCFWSILSHIPALMNGTQELAASEKACSSLLRLLEWKLSARDFSYLIDTVPIFKILQPKGNSPLQQLVGLQDNLQDTRLRIFK